MPSAEGDDRAMVAHRHEMAPAVSDAVQIVGRSRNAGGPGSAGCLRFEFAGVADRHKQSAAVSCGQEKIGSRRLRNLPLARFVDVTMVGSWRS